MINKFKFFENKDIVENDSNKNYIILIPSGEILYVDTNTLYIIISKRLVFYYSSYKGAPINKYCSGDSNKNIILNIIKTEDLKKDNNSGKHEEICKDFILNMAEITGEKYVVAYNSENGKYSYYIIIPGLLTSSKYNNNVKELYRVLNKMRNKYPGRQFNYTERVMFKPVIYYQI